MIQSLEYNIQFVSRPPQSSFIETIFGPKLEQILLLVITSE